MKKQIDKVMPARIRLKNLAVQHMRQRCQRMIIIGVNTRKRPDDILQSQAAGYMAVLIDVNIIIKAYKPVMQYRLKSSESYHRQEYINQMNVILFSVYIHLQLYQRKYL